MRSFLVDFFLGEGEGMGDELFFFKGRGIP